MTAALKTGAYPVSIVSGDWNGDGLFDLAVSNHLDNSISIFFGDGLGNFTAAAAPLAAVGLWDLPPAIWMEMETSTLWLPPAATMP